MVFYKVKKKYLYWHKDRLNGQFKFLNNIFTLKFMGY
jgi:hypothetical protein